MDKIMTIIIVFSGVFFIYNKIKTWRTPESLLKRIYQTKANISIGFFLVAVSINLLYSPRSTVDVVVGIAFLILGAVNVVLGYKAYRHYIPQFKNQ
ncbi:YtpI family protein [Bacillus sp. FJAT-45037]|uniref:YtpI family protein n=1 Tax=Bacillus sp. FJAT-45037 TaxID=2011007 RepID=UPI000C247225|nr:YtpI family protein [Bacillus sp. FJAT-45037]